MDIREKEDIKEKILFTSEGLFKKYGIRSITMDDIAKELGISKKTIYHYFKDKNEIVMQIIQHFLEEDERCMQEIELSSSNALEAVLQMSEYFRQEVSKMNPAMLYDLQKYHAEVWQNHSKLSESRFIDYFKKNYEWGLQDNLYRRDVNVEILARLRMGEFNLIFDEKIFPRTQFDVIDVQMTLTEHFLRGMLTIRGFEILEVCKNKILN